MWKSLFFAICLAGLSACAVTSPAPIELSVISDDLVEPTRSDVAGWARHTPWDSEAAGIQRTRSGLEYVVLASGDPAALPPKARDEVAVNYEGRVASDGSVVDRTFDEPTAALIEVSDVVSGWSDALQLMRPGDRWLIHIPARLAYGNRPPANVPKNADLVFEVKLLGVTE